MSSVCGAKTHREEGPSEPICHLMTPLKGFAIAPFSVKPNPDFGEKQLQDVADVAQITNSSLKIFTEQIFLLLPHKQRLCLIFLPLYLSLHWPKSGCSRGGGGRTTTQGEDTGKKGSERRSAWQAAASDQPQAGVRPLCSFRIEKNASLKELKAKIK